MKTLLSGIGKVVKFIFGTIAVVGLFGLLIGMLIGIAI